MSNVTEINAGNIELTYLNLNSHLFINSIQKLASSKALPVATKLKVGKIKEALFKASEAAQKTWKETLDTKIEWDGEGDDKKPKSMEQYKEVENDFLKATVNLGIKKLNAVNLKLAINDLSSDELCAIEPVVEGLQTLAQEGEE